MSILFLSSSSSSSSFLSSFLSTSVLLLLLLLLLLLPPPSCCYCDALSLSPDDHHISGSRSRGTGLTQAMFLFSDSLGDTGNGAFVNHTRATRLPFGITVPGFPTGRFSDGRVLVSDFIAEYLSLPPLKPWLNVEEDFRHGANYAIPGSTATDMKPFSLQEQVGWHLQLVALAVSDASSSSSAFNVTHFSPRTKLPSLEVIQEALYVISIGGLDYRRGYIYKGLSPDLVGSTTVPLVVEQIQIALERLYNESGARKFMVVGVPAQGCMPATLAALWTEMEVNDTSGCIDAVNAICESHAHGVQSMLQSLRELHSDAMYTFLDFYQAHLYILERASDFGFTNTFDACCGAGPSFPYGYNATHRCKNETSSSSFYVCDNPLDYINWDGLHFTHSFIALLFNQTIVANSFLHPPNGLGFVEKKKVKYNSLRACN